MLLQELVLSVELKCLNLQMPKTKGFSKLSKDNNPSKVSKKLGNLIVDDVLRKVNENLKKGNIKC